MHLEIGCRRGVGIHWGTFTTSAHACSTLDELDVARKRSGVSRNWQEEGAFVTGNIGTWMEVET